MARLLVIFVILSAFLWSCLPGPGDKVEWLQREDSIIVQVRTSGGDSMAWTTDRERMPAFTLYGDGRLIVSESTTDCGEIDNPCSARLLESHLPEESVQNLIDFIDGSGFFNFQYQQPIPPVSGAPTTYIYVNTKLAANAVRAEAVGWEAPDDAEWSEFRKLGTIKDSIVDLQGNAFATSSQFAPEEGLLQVVPRVATDLTDVAEWPYPAIALPVNAPLDEVSELTLSAEQLASMALERPNETTCETQVQSGGRLYDVCYRPVLPYEENFPEFEP